MNIMKYNEYIMNYKYKNISKRNNLSDWLLGI